MYKNIFEKDYFFFKKSRVGFTQHHFFSKKSGAGFTLIELLVAMGIFTLIALAASWLLIHGFRYNAVVWEQLKTQNDGRRALQEIVDVARRAEESSLGSYPLVTVGDYEIVFYANVDADSYRERVRFWLDGTTLKRGFIKPSGNPLSYSGVETITEIAHDVVNFNKSVPIFLYYDENYTGSQSALTQPVELTEVRAVRVQLELEKDPTATPVPLHVESVVQIRNLKSN